MNTNNGWLGIASAPKDGTEILAWRSDCGQFIASYTSADAFPMTQAELDSWDEETLFAKDWFTQWPQALRLEGSEVPTLWQPLPAAPAAPVSTVEAVEAVARAIWHIRREHEDRCDMELEDMGEDHPVWDEARAALATVPAPAAGDAQAGRDSAFEAVRKRLCAIPRYSFCLDDDGVVRRVEGRSGNWIEFDAAHELFDPVCVDAAIAAQRKGDA